MVSGDEEFVLWDGCVNFAGCGWGGDVFCLFVGVKAVRVLVVKDGVVAVFENDALSAKCDDALDDELAFVCGIDLWVFKNDDLSALWGVVFAAQVRKGHRDAVDEKTVSGVERLLHAWADDAVATKNKGIDKNSAKNNESYKKPEIEGVFDKRMA